MSGFRAEHYQKEADDADLVIESSLGLVNSSDHPRKLTNRDGLIRVLGQKTHAQQVAVSNLLRTKQYIILSKQKLRPDRRVE